MSGANDNGPGGLRAAEEKTTVTPSIAPACFLGNDTEKIALNSARREKELATLIAKFALAGHQVHRGQCGDFNVCKQGLSKYCQDPDALLAFARLVGAAS